MKSQASKKIIEQHGAKTIIEALDPYINDQRKKRINTILENRLNSIQLAIECPFDIKNALAAVRSSEALGISTIHIIRPEGDPGSMRRLTQGAFHWINILFYENLERFIEKIKSENFLLAGGVVNAPMNLTKISVKKPLCLMIGNEHHGLSEKAKSACDFLYSIPMAGMSESLNLSVSAAISLYDTTQRKRQALKKQGDLTTEQVTETRAHYYLNSVNRRLVDGLFFKTPHPTSPQRGDEISE